MIKIFTTSKHFLALVITLAISLSVNAQVKTVRFTQLSTGQWQTLVDGQPYYVKGVCGKADDRIDLLPAYGVNSIRSYDAKNDMDFQLADSAQKYGLTLSQGLWIPHQSDDRKGAEYSEAEFTRNLITTTLAKVRRLVNKPSIIFWNLGNEMNLGNFELNPNMYNIMGQIADSIKRIDNNRRPVITTIAQFNTADVITKIYARAPAIDMVAINSYGGIDAVDDIYLNQGNKPYMITEWGLSMYNRTTFASLIEENSTVAGQSLITRYQRNMVNKPMRCLGSYLFLYGYKVIETPTWYSFMIPLRKDTLQAVFSKMDAMQYNFTGSYPARLAPVMDSLRVNGKAQSSSLIVNPGSLMSFIAKAHNPDGSPLKYYYKLCYEIDKVVDGGIDPDNVVESNVFKIGTAETSGTFKAPYGPDRYRLYVYTVSNTGRAAYESFPFMVANMPGQPVLGNNTLYPVKDAYVSQANDTAQYGKKDIANLATTPAGVTNNEKYIQFQFETPKHSTGLLTKAAVLRLHPQSNFSGRRFLVRGFSSTQWFEKEVTWEKREQTTLAAKPLFEGELNHIGAAPYLEIPLDGWFLRSMIDTATATRQEGFGITLQLVDDGSPIAFNSKEADGDYPPQLIWQTDAADNIPCDAPKLTAEVNNLIAHPCGKAVFTLSGYSRCGISAVLLNGNPVKTYDKAAYPVNINEAIFYEVPATANGQLPVTLAVVDAQTTADTTTTSFELTVTGKKCGGTPAVAAVNPIVAPNPVVNNQLIITNLGNASTLQALSIYDVLGRKVYNAQGVRVNNGKANLQPNLEAGWYCLVVMQGGKTTKTAFVAVTAL